MGDGAAEGQDQADPGGDRVTRDPLHIAIQWVFGHRMADDAAQEASAGLHGQAGRFKQEIQIKGRFPLVCVDEDQVENRLLSWARIRRERL